MRSFFIAYNIHAKAREVMQAMHQELQTINAELQSKAEDPGQCHQ